MPRSTTVRAEYTFKHDLYLTKYLAVYCPSKEGRNGNAVYKQLVDNAGNKWPWSAHHSWQSWRARYVKNSAQFDAAIFDYQKKYNIKPKESLKRPAGRTSIEPLGGPSTKRVRVRLVQEEDSSGETRGEPEPPHSNATPASRPASQRSLAPSSLAPPGAPVSSEDVPSTPLRPTPKSTTRHPPPLSQPRPASPVSGPRPNGTPVAATTQDRAKEAESPTKWPPVRSHSGQKKASEPDVEAETRHPFDQSQPPPGAEAILKAEQSRRRRKPFNPFAPRLESNRRAVAARSTQRHLPRTIEIESRKNSLNGKYERSRSRAPVPSIDLVAISSARSHSRSSTDASAPARAQRQSFPAFDYSPLVFNQVRGPPSAPGSAPRTSSSFKWTLPSPVYRHTTSSPSFSPWRSVATDTDASPRPSINLMPHSSDLSLTASQGLATMLDRMSANHGLGMTVVETVYKCVGSLREADEVLKLMREAAETAGQRELERRGRGRRRVERGRQGRRRGTMLRYVAVSDDGEGSEYSPPETSRAALWKRQSESTGHTSEDGEGEKEESGSESHSEEDGMKEKASGEDEGVDKRNDDEEEETGGDETTGEDSGDHEEEAEGRAVEAELRVTEDEINGDAPSDTPHPNILQELPAAGEEDVFMETTDQDAPPFEKAIMKKMEAKKLERKMGKNSFRKAILERFIFT